MNRAKTRLVREVGVVYSYSHLLEGQMRKEDAMPKGKKKRVAGGYIGQAVRGFPEYPADKPKKRKK